MKSGIYMWTSPSGKKYVGQTEDLAKRKTVFLCEKAYYAGSKLQNARKKYPDFTKWDYEVLEYCDLDKLSEREMFWIKEKDSFKSGYNMTIGGGGARGADISEETREKQRKAKLGTKMSESAKAKMSMFRKGKKKTAEHIRKIGEAHKGKIMSDDTKCKLSEAQKAAHLRNPEHYIHSQATRAKISQSNNGRIYPTLRKPIKQCDLNGNLIRVWECASVAAKTLGFNASPIAACMKGKTKTYKGFQWKYA